MPSWTPPYPVPAFLRSGVSGFQRDGKLQVAVIDRREILEAAGELGLQAQVVEKDYVLGWILAGIYSHAHLGGTWVFKGGTCLKKCYFETYRFSEDLDFTLINAHHIDEKFLVNHFKKIAEWIYDTTGIKIIENTIRFEIYQNQEGRTAIEGSLNYVGPL